MAKTPGLYRFRIESCVGGWGWTLLSGNGKRIAHSEYKSARIQAIHSAISFTRLLRLDLKTRIEK